MGTERVVVRIHPGARKGVAFKTAVAKIKRFPTSTYDAGTKTWTMDAKGLIRDRWVEQVEP